MSNKILSMNEISELSNISVKIIRREVASGKLKSFKEKNKIKIYENDYNTWLFSYKNQKTQRKITTVQKNDIVNWIDISSDMQSIDAWNNPNQRNGYNFIDLFSGAGGLSCGLVMAGFTPIGSVEIMDAAVKTYERNFIKTKGFNEKVETRDIREQSVKDELIKSINQQHVDLIVGGFPCQGFSMAGNRIVNDQRNSLYKEMLSIVSQVKPDFVVMENVEGLRSMLDGKIEEKIISDYKAIGYEINVTVLNAADYGVPQLRKRVIFIGNRIGKTNYHPAPIFSSENYKTVEDGIIRFMNISENKSINHEFTKHTNDIKNRLKLLQEGQSLYENYSDAWKRVFWKKPSPTVKENHGGVNVHPLLPRVMTPRELASLQSFPDDFIFEGAKKWQLVQIGNAVPPLLGKAIGLAVKKSIQTDNNMGN